jgi:hypothetical protein
MGCDGDEMRGFFPFDKLRVRMTKQVGLDGIRYSCSACLQPAVVGEPVTWGVAPG